MSAELEISIFASPGGKDSLSWLLDISVNDQPSPGPTTLRHPFNEEQRTNCRWYEEFVCKSPYSITRARNTASSLRQYSKSLLDQLGLVKLVKDDFASHSRGNRSIEISISEEEGAEHSVHQLQWELLEDPSVWDIEVQVTVKRLLILEKNFRRAVVRDVRLDEERNSALPRVNGLLVVARDLSPDLKRYDDVSPHLALGVLARIKDDLQRSRSQTYLHLEVVRPGTLEALEKHLKRVTEIHGKNYYDFAHFDVHGIVKSKEGAGYLLFNDPRPDVHTTASESAKTVADILEQYGVAVAVLNACESAKADCGDAANIAKTFARSGVQNVLAMSFRISRSAAELVLRAFYHSLFLEGNTFSHAARRAREVLRLHPVRQARLDLKRSLVDYFVPVVYICGEDSRLAPVTRKSTSLGLPDTYDFALRTVPFAGKDERQLIGREFDLLRLEKKLLAQGRVHLTGRAGVGKSALLRHACGIWQQTSFVDIVLFVDFTKIRSLADVLGLLVSQIPLSLLTVRKLRTMMSSPVFDSAMFAKFLLGTYSKSRLMIILDGMHVFYPTNLYSLADTPSKEALPMLSRFMEALLSLGGAGTPHIAVYHIVVSRFTSSTNLPFSEKVLKDLFSEQNLFRLPSLRLSDSVELSLLALRDAGVNVDIWVDADLNELELLLGLLDGNPSAILLVLPQMAQTGMSSREFRGLVQHGVLPISYTGHATNMFKEIENIFYALGDEACDFLLLLLSTVWLESMGVGCLLGWTISHKICTNEITHWVMEDIHVRGLIDVGVGELSLREADIVVTWIHPLLTICARQIAHQIMTDRQIHSGAAALVLSTLGVQLDEIKLSEQMQILCTDFKTWFLQSVTTFDLCRTRMRLWATGLSHQDLHATWPLAAGNLATCLSICTRQPYMPIDQWPLEYFGLYVARIFVVGSRAQVADYAKSFEQLFEIFINLNGSLAIPPLYQQYALRTVTSLTTIYLTLLEDPAKYKKYLNIGLRIVEESEERFGTFKDSWVRWLKGVSLRHHAVYLMLFGSGDQVVEVWETSLDNDKSIFENPHSLGFQWSPEQIQALANNFSTSEGDAEAITKRLGALSVNSGLEAHHKYHKNCLYSIRALVSALDKTEYDVAVALSTRKLPAILARHADGLVQVCKAYEAMGFRGLNQDERCWGDYGFEMNGHFIPRVDNLEENLAGLEIAKSTGNTAEAFERLWTLYKQAFENLEVDEVEEYVNEMKRYSEHVSPAEAHSIDWEKTKGEITLCKTMTGILLGNSTEAIGGMNDRDGLVESIEKQIRLLMERNAPRESIEVLEISREMWLKESKIDEIHREQASQLMGSWQNSVRLLSRKVGDEEFMQNLPKVNLEFLQHMQRLQEAELKGDHKLALERLEVVEEFLRQPGNEIFRDFVGKDWPSKRRLYYEFVQVYFPIREQLSDALGRFDYDERHRIIANFKNAPFSAELRQCLSGSPLGDWMAGTQE